MSSAPEIFNCDDTMVENEQMVEESTSLELENPPKAIPDETLDSPPQAVIISNQYPSTLINSEGFQLELLNQDAADQVSSKNTEVSLFQVMKLMSDKHELSFIEKIHLPEEQILRLCNRIVPNSAENQYPDIRIDFNSLNQLSLPTIGFYGDKRTVGRILKDMGVVEDSIHMQMEEEKFEA